MDYLIINAKVVDGSGRPAYLADIELAAGRIKSIRPHRGNMIHAADASGSSVIDAAGRYLTPGFIDVHRHADMAVFRKGFGEAELRQGLTTIINGNCGLSVVPCPEPVKRQILDFLSPVTGSLPDGVNFDDFEDYMEALPKDLPLNVGMLIGDGTVRSAAAGYRAGALSREEYDKVHDYIARACDAGAFGVSIGLQYAPEMYYSRNELAEALKPMKGRGIPLCTHTRGDGDSMLESLDEVISIAEELEIPLQVSHFKNMGRAHWGKRTGQGLAKLDAARARGLDVYTDLYPYTYGTTQFVQVIPPSFMAGGLEVLSERLKDPEQRKKLREIFETGEEGFENYYKLLGWDNFLLTTFVTPANAKYTGMRVTDIAAARGQDCFDCVCDLLAEEKCRIGMIDYIVSEEDLREIMRYSHSMIISDSTYPDTGRLHPRVYGTYTRILESYVRDEKVLNIETAVNKMTGMPAERFGIRNKGFIREGYDADICIFDLNNIRTNSTLEKPDCPGSGFDYVFVGGEPAVINDSLTGRRSGHPLRKQ